MNSNVARTKKACGQSGVSGDSGELLGVGHVTHRLAGKQRGYANRNAPLGGATVPPTAANS